MTGEPYSEESSSATIILNLAQLIRFNSFQSKRKDKEADIRHSKLNEPPFPVMLGLSVHAKTRKKSLVESLASHGLSITYNRVQSIQESITRQLCQKYSTEGIVCPPKLEKHLFTHTAIDNIDHNPTSSTATDSFHGTSISIFQENRSDTAKIYTFDTVSNSDKKCNTLPESYTEIKPSVYTSKPEPPKTNNAAQNNLYSAANLEWSSVMQQFETLKNNELVTLNFSGFHCNRLEAASAPVKFSSTLLPLITESINTPSVVKHCMEVLQKLVYHINPAQMTIITGDQPVYALGKQIQWKYEGSYENIIWMMGPLHIEMALMSTIGDLLDSSGWTDIFQRAGINTTGRADSFLTGKKVKRTRYAHQVSLVSLLSIAQKSFEIQDKICSFSDWKNDLRRSSINAEYWFTVIELQTLLFSFIKSIRIGDFNLFLYSIQEMLPWFFAFDHANYARWLSVFFHEMLNLNTKDATTYQKFCDGYFTINKTGRTFSNMGVDQMHEQNNKVVKSDGGAIGIFDNHSALLKWAVAGPVIGDLIYSFTENKKQESQSHHEDTKNFESTFRTDTEKFIESFLECCNPFEETGELVHITSKHIMDVSVNSNVRNMKEIGTKQFNTFIEKRLDDKSISIYDKIKKNNLYIFKSRHFLSGSKSKQKVANLDADRRLFANLYIASKSRNSNLTEFFAHENHPYPVAISEYGELRKCSAKSDFLECLEELSKPHYESPVVQVKVIDGPAFVNVNPPRISKTYGEYCGNELKEKIVKQSEYVERLDIVFDIYKNNSLKSQARKNRGEGVRVSVRNETPVLKQFHKFMRNNENKTELFRLISTALTTLIEPPRKIVATIDENVVSNFEENKEFLQPCNHEEADTRVLLHVKDASMKGYDKVMISTVDTDVVVNAIYSFESLNVAELWIEFGTGKHKRYFPIHEYCAILSKNVCQGLLFWYALTGCDTVSMFKGIGKKTCWKVWLMNNDVIECFVRLSDDWNLNEEKQSAIERFIVLLYDRTSTHTGVNDCRFELFTKKGRSIENIPPTKDALNQHTLRALLQARVWRQSLEKQQIYLNPCEFGWKWNGETYEPLWMTKNEAVKECKELIKCKCKSACNARCTCRKSGLSCTDLCLCGGDCDSY